MPKADAATVDLRAAGIARGAAFEIEFDGRPIAAHEGETVLGALWAAGVAALHVTARSGEPRGFYCGMGACFDCLAEVDGARNTRTCLTPARPGLVVRTQQDAGDYPAAGAVDDA
jgi:predicted molibdopterin-dependent oxidoreductase YjgC